MGFFAIIPGSIIIIFLYSIQIDLRKLKIFNLNLVLIIYTFLIAFILTEKKIKIVDIDKFPNKKIEKIKTEKRKGFGVKPIILCNNLFESNFCWLEKDCYFIENDARIEYLIFNYMLVSKIEERKTLQCK